LNLGSGLDEVSSLQDVTLRYCLVSDLSRKCSGLILGGRNVQDIVTYEGGKISCRIID